MLEYKIMKSDKKSFQKFKQRWRVVQAIEEHELRNMSIQEKFIQLVSLMRMGLGLGFRRKEDEETLAVRARWIKLKKELGS